MATHELQRQRCERGPPPGTRTGHARLFRSLAVFNGINPNGTWRLYVSDDEAGDSGTITGGWSITITTSVPLPAVTSIARASANPTTFGALVNYTVTFNMAVTGVDASDFTISTVAGSAGGSIGAPTGGPTAWTVPVTVGPGQGQFRLNLIDDDSITGGGFALGGAGTGNGNFLTGQAYTVVPGNDACASALSFPLADGGTVTGSTVFATNDGSASCGSSNSSPDVWFAYTATHCGPTTISTVNPGTDYDTVLSVRTACGGGGGAEVVCNDDLAFPELRSQVTFNAVAGTTYRVRVSGFSGEAGNYEVTCVESPVAPAITSADTVPATGPTNNNNIMFRVFFDEDLVNVDAGDASFGAVAGTVSFSGTTFDYNQGPDRARWLLTGVTGDGILGGTLLDGPGAPQSECDGETLAGLPFTFPTIVVDNTAPNPGAASVDEDCTASSSVTVNFGGADDPIVGTVNSGVDGVGLYYSFNNGPFTFTGMTSPTTSGSFNFTFADGEGTYGFALRAQDGAGNLSPVPTIADDTVNHDLTPPVIADCPADFTTPCNTDAGYNLAYTPSVIDGCSTTFTIDPPNPIDYGTHTVTVTVTDSAGNSSECSFEITVLPDPQEPVRAFSVAAQDGFVREPNLTLMIEGPVNSKATTLSVGDDAQNWLNRAVLSFNTSSIPADATITSARIRLTRASVFGNVAPLGSLVLDMGGPIIGSLPTMEPADYDDASAAFLNVATSFPMPGGNDHTTFIDIDPARFGDFDRAGTTQFRVRFSGTTDGDNLADYIAFHSGEAGATVRPELIVEFYKPDCFDYPVPPSPMAGPFVATIFATPAEDGGLTESHWTSEVGGTANAGASTAPIGDTASRQQLMLLLSFDTASIPANATIHSAELRLFHTSRIASPGSLGSLVADMRNPYLSATSFMYGSTAIVQAEDFQGFSHYPAVATLALPALTNQFTLAFLNPTGLLGINKGGTTQMKIRYTTGDNGNALSDRASFATGNYGATSPGRPALIITYSTP